MKKNFVSIIVVSALLYNCASTNTLHTENNFTAFPSSSAIYLETDPEIVPLSSRLSAALGRANFLITDSRKDADYILKFDYDARFDVYPWVFTSFNLTLREKNSNTVFYRVTTDNFKPEKVDSLIARAVHDMASRLLAHSPPALVIR
jgi:hypothetical protein